MKLIEQTPFTYLIGWSKHDKWYYGVRYAVNCSYEDLWTTYFTSSSQVAWMREFFGEPDIIKIRKTFSDKHLAIKWEHKVLRKLKVVKNDRWLNKNAGIAIAILKTPEHKYKIGQSNKGNIRVDLAAYNKTRKEKFGFGRTHNIKGKKLFHNVETLKQSYFKIGEEPHGWLIGSCDDRNKGFKNPRYKAIK